MAGFGETRKLSKLAGRTNRASPAVVKSLLTDMRELKLSSVDWDERSRILRAMQSHIVVKYIAAYHKLQKVKAVYDPSAPTSRFIANIIENASKSGKAGPVAEHLVAAKLQLRFPTIQIRQKSSSEGDTQGGFSSDVEIGDTTFHVTTAPMPELYDKITEVLASGMRVYLLVPASIVIGTRQNAEAKAEKKVAVEAIESFVATNIDEISEFKSMRLKDYLKRLVEVYNQRIVTNESDQSLLIELPANLG